MKLLAQNAGIIPGALQPAASGAGAGPATYVAMSVMLIAVGLLASYLPARRASKVDPMESLRGE